jgi:hypothetical protein
MVDQPDRRSFFGQAFAGAAATGLCLGAEERRAQAGIAAQAAGGVATDASKAYHGDPLPLGHIGRLAVSRLFLGGNLIAGYAHSRDLMYVSRLFREYNTEAKVFETLALAEQSGINTILINPGAFDVVERYRQSLGGKIQAMVCVDVDPNDESAVKDQVKSLVDRGIETLYTHGERTDHCTRAGKVDVITRVIETIRAAGVPAGVGSHSLETPIACEKDGVPADYYVKTFHPDAYWSATPAATREEWCWYDGKKPEHDRYHDNIFDLDPRRTSEFMRTVSKPWVAFKVMAAGAINPQVAFPFAYGGGADFIVAGMFDFQVAADVEIAVKALRRTRNRERPWQE